MNLWKFSTTTLALSTSPNLTVIKNLTALIHSAFRQPRTRTTHITDRNYFYISLRFNLGASQPSLNPLGNIFT